MKNKSTGKKLLKGMQLFSILVILLNCIPQLSFSQYTTPRQPLENRLLFPASQKLDPANARPLEKDKHYIPSQNLPADIISQQPWGSQQTVNTASLNKTKKIAPNAPIQKLSRSTIKKIIGNDKVLGKDEQGHQLYREPGGEIYYLSNTGTKVPIFLIIAQ